MKADNTKFTQTTTLSEQDIAKHKSLIDFDDKDAVLLKGHEAVIKGKIDSLVEQFYQHQMTVPEIAAVIDIDDRLSQLKQTMAQYILELFGGVYGVDYVNRRLEIGRAHENLGVAARYYLASVYQLEMLLQQTIDEANSPLKAALHKVVEFDVQIVMDNYIENLMHKVKIAQDELEDYAEGLEEVVTERTRQLNELSRKDELTELFNRHGMLENLRRELANAARYKESISFVCFTLNGYQALVAGKGQAVGNVVLNQIGHDIKSQIREADVACRAADDEFCIIMPRTIAKEAKAICQRLIDMFKKNNQHNLSFSIGIATTGPDEVSETGMFMKQAEDLMQTAGNESGFVICSNEADVS